jgi:subfamily B ATP-binding cassette protein MsbA
MKQFLRILTYAKPYWIKLGLGFVLILIVGQAQILMPLVQKFVIDDIGLLQAKESLVSINLTFTDDLANSEGAAISEALRSELAGQRLLLSPNTTVSTKEQGREWRIADQENNQQYIIRQYRFKISGKAAREVGLLHQVILPPERGGDSLNGSERPQPVSNDLLNSFKEQGVLLSPTATVSVAEAGRKWVVADGEKHHVILKTAGVILKTAGALHVYEGVLRVYPAQITHRFFGRDFSYSSLGWLVVVLCVIIGLYATFTILSYIRTYVMTWASSRILFDMRNQVFAHMQKLSMRFYDVQGTGQILSRVREDVSALRSLVTETSINIISDTVMLIFILVIMFKWHWKLTLLSLLVLPLMVGNYFFFIDRMRPIWRIWRHKWADISTALYETVAGAQVVKAFNREHYQERKLFHDMRQTLQWQIDIAKNRTAMSMLSVFFRRGGSAMVLCYGGYLVLQGEFTIGKMVAFYYFLDRLYSPLMQLININTTIQEAMVSAERVFGMLDSEPMVAEAPDAVELPPIRGHVKFENVSFSYEPENPVLHNINLDVKPDMMVAFVGPSGCGKSTIANLIARFYDVTDGAITIDEHDIREVKIKSLRNQLGIVLQDNFLFQGSIAENIRFGRLNATDEEVVNAAFAANAHQFIVEQLPEGYETEVGERGMRLSGGQKQRIAIARTILRNPRILILDEATSALDSESEEQIQSALDRLMKERTSFVIAHRLSTILKADMIVVLNDGRIVETGTHEQLLDADGKYAEMYRIQFKAKSHLI